MQKPDDRPCFGEFPGLMQDLCSLSLESAIGSIYNCSWHFKRDPRFVRGKRAQFLGVVVVVVVVMRNTSRNNLVTLQPLSVFYVSSMLVAACSGAWQFLSERCCGTLFLGGGAGWSSWPLKSGDSGRGRTCGGVSGRCC